MKKIISISFLVFCVTLFSACNDRYEKGVVISETPLHKLDSVERDYAQSLLDDDVYLDVRLSSGKLVHAAGVLAINPPGTEVRVRRDGNLLFIGH